MAADVFPAHGQERLRAAQTAEKKTTTGPLRGDNEKDETRARWTFLSRLRKNFVRIYRLLKHISIFSLTVIKE